MTKKFKRILFISALIGFLVCAPALIFYSQGYRIDFQNKKIVQTGGFFFNVSPNGSMVSIDKNLSKKTSFIFGSSFISGLMPKKYEVKIEKQDYHPWTKTLEVKEQKVTECKNIQLFPKNPEFSFLTSEVEDFFPLPNQKQIIIKQQGWVLKLFNLETQESSLIVKQQGLADQDPVLQEIKVSEDSKKAIIKTSLKGENKFFLIDLNGLEKPLLVNPDFKIKNIVFKNSNQLFFIGINVPKDEKENYDQSLFSFQENSVKEIDLPIAKQKIITFALINENIVWLNEAGFLYKGQIKENKVELLEILNLKPLSIHEQANYKIIINDFSQIFVKEDETLYFLNPENHSLIRIFASLKEYQFSADNKKLALRNDNEIIVFFNQEQTEQPQKKEQEKVRLIGTTKKIDNLFWLNNHYLVFKNNDSIEIIEIDDRDKPNLVELTTFPNLKISFLEKQKLLLVLSKNKLYFSKDVLK